MSKMPRGWNSHAELHYSRDDDVARFISTGLVNHEIRSIVVGMWARLDREDRLDLINELVHYQAAQSGHIGAIASGFVRALAGSGENLIADFSEDLSRSELKRLPL